MSFELSIHSLIVWLPHNPELVTPIQLLWRVNKVHTHPYKENTNDISQPHITRHKQRYLDFMSLNVAIQTMVQIQTEQMSYQYKEYHCGENMVVRSSYLHNGIYYFGKMTSLYWLRAQITQNRKSVRIENNDEIKWHSVVLVRLELSNLIVKAVFMISIS